MKLKFRLRHKGPKRLVIEYVGVFESSTISIDGREIASFPTREAAELGARVVTEEGQLEARLRKALVIYEWELSLNGVPLPNSANDTRLAVSVAIQFAAAGSAVRLWDCFTWWRDGVPLTAMWPIAVPLILAAAAVLLLWRRQKSGVPLMVATAVSWVATDYLWFGGIPWLTVGVAALFVSAAFKARRLLSSQGAAWRGAESAASPVAVPVGPAAPRPTTPSSGA